MKIKMNIRICIILSKSFTSPEDSNRKDEIENNVYIHYSMETFDLDCSDIVYCNVGKISSSRVHVVLNHWSNEDN